MTKNRPGVQKRVIGLHCTFDCDTSLLLQYYYYYNNNNNNNNPIIQFDHYKEIEAISTCWARHDWVEFHAGSAVCLCDYIGLYTCDLRYFYLWFWMFDILRATYMYRYLSRLQ